MLDQQDRAAIAADFVQQLAQLGLLRGVHAGGRLVEREQLGFGGQGARDFQAALVPVRQVARREVGVATDAHIVEQRVRLFEHVGFLFANRRRPEDCTEHAGVGLDVPSHHDVFECRHFAEQPDVLERAGDACLGDFVHGGGPIRPACERKIAGVRHVKAGDHVEERCLAGTVGPDQAVDFALVDMQADVGQRLQAAEPLVDTLDREKNVEHAGLLLRARRVREWRRVDPRGAARARCRQADTA